MFVPAPHQREDPCSEDFVHFLLHTSIVLSVFDFLWFWFLCVGRIRPQSLLILLPLSTDSVTRTQGDYETFSLFSPELENPASQPPLDPLDRRQIPCWKRKAVSRTMESPCVRSFRQSSDASGRGELRLAGFREFPKPPSAPLADPLGLSVLLVRALSNTQARQTESASQGAPQTAQVGGLVDG